MLRMDFYAGVHKIHDHESLPVEDLRACDHGSWDIAAEFLKLFVFC